MWSTLTKRRPAVWSAGAALAGTLVLVGIAPPERVPVTSFRWVHPASTPVGWQRAVTPSGASLAYPPSWRTIASDPGTVVAGPPGSHPARRGFVKATPSSGGRTLAGWARSRVAHLAGQGALDVRVEGAAGGLRFARGATGSCVIDSYSTRATRFREIACLVGGRTTTAVIAAAPVAGWAEHAPLLERAVTSFET